MKELSLLDEAEVKANMRDMYREVGYLGALQCLYEIIASAELLIQVMTEEIKDEKETV